MCTHEEDIEELNEMYGPLCWQGDESDHEGVQLQSYLHVVTLRPCERNGVHAQSTWRQKATVESAVGPHHQAQG